MTPARLRLVQLYANPTEQDKLRRLRRFCDAVDQLGRALDQFEELLARVQERLRMTGAVS